MVHRAAFLVEWPWERLGNYKVCIKNQLGPSPQSLFGGLHCFLLEVCSVSVVAMVQYDTLHDNSVEVVTKRHVHCIIESHQLE